MMKFQGIDTCQNEEELGILKAELLKTEGNIAEVGVYFGGTVKLMSDLCPDREIYGFDTFEGLPYISEEKGDTKTFPLKIGSVNAGYETTKHNLESCKNVSLFKGIFPESSKPIKDKKFGFVHLDMDIYKSTKEGLEFFLSRTNGTILIHDYGHHLGVTNAVNEFCAEHNLEVKKLSQRQGIIKI